MPTKGPSEQQEEERNIELENTVGNLMVAKYLVDRLRTRLSDSIRGGILISVKIEELMVDISQDLKEQEDDGVYELR
jgi:hypothetical protein